VQDAQFVFVTEDARVMAKLMDGRLQDITETCELLPQPNSKAREKARLEKKRALMRKFAI